MVRVEGVGNNETTSSPDPAEELLIAHPEEAVRWLRGRLGMSQLRLALLLGVSPSSGAKWERGRSGLQLRTRRSVAQLLGPLLDTSEGASWRATLEREGGGR